MSVFNSFQSSSRGTALDADSAAVDMFNFIRERDRRRKDRVKGRAVERSRGW